MNHFGKKTYGRIYVDGAENVAAVTAVIKELDEFEYGYLPADFVAPWTGKIEPVYGWKFEMDMDVLTETCWQRGLRIFCISNRRDPLEAFS